jgi:hypothetical protein
MSRLSRKRINAFAVLANRRQWGRENYAPWTPELEIETESGLYIRTETSTAGHPLYIRTE